VPSGGTGHGGGFVVRSGCQRIGAIVGFLRNNNAAAISPAG
jgi:hypothetical protein